MLNWIIDFSLRHRGLILALAALLIVTGAISMKNLSIDAMPDATDVMVQVNTVAPSLSPLEIEQQITFPVEQELSGMPNLKLVRSISKFGLSQVTVVFEDGTDLYFARNQVMERLLAIELAEGIERPTMGPIATGLGEIYHYIVTAPGGDLTDARTQQDWILRPQLVSVKGVAEVNSWGGYQKQYQVIVDPDRLLKHGLTMQDLVAALKNSNLNVGGGGVGSGGELQLLHGVGLLVTLEDIGGVTIETKDGRPLRVRDVADVVEGRAQRRGVVTINGNGEAVLGLGFMLMGQNSHEVAARLDKRMADAKKSLPEGTNVRVVYDRTELVDQVINTVKKNLFEGALLVIAILFLFLGNFRAAFIVALAIPLSMLFAFNLMLQTGIAGTLMSLGALDFGLIVDSSVIMVENSVRRLQQDATGRPVVEVVADASKEVRKPTMFGELIIIIVYLPILALEGVEGKLFIPMALTVVFALFGSMVLSLTLMPVLASFFLTRGTAARKEPWIVRASKRLYRPIVRWTVGHRVLVLGSALIIVFGTVPLALNLGTIFVPKLGEGSIVINTVRLPGVSVDESARFSTQIERHLLDRFPDEIDTIWTRTGTPEVATDPMGIEVSDVFITLKPRDQWKSAHTQEELVREMDKVLRPMPGMNFSFTQPIEMRFNEMISGVRTDIGVKIFGDDFGVLRDFATRIDSILRGIPGEPRSAVEPLVGQPVLQVRLNAQALSRHGLNARQVLDFIESIGGKNVGEIREGQKRFPLAVRLPQRYESNPDLLGTLMIPTQDGQRLPLSRLADIRRTSGPVVINREWSKRRALVTCNVLDRDLGSFVAEARERIEAELGDELRAAGCRVEFGGQFENLERASEKLTEIVPIALALIFFLLYTTFGSVGDALKIFTGVPFAVVGGVMALQLRDMPFSISAGVGFIAVSGVAVLNGLVLVSAIRRLLSESVPLREAVLKAAETRLRPVLMTALVASLGFLPMALNTGIGAEVQRPLATVVIAGLVSSTLLTLFVLPALYMVVSRKRSVQPYGSRASNQADLGNDRSGADDLDL